MNMKIKAITAAIMAATISVNVNAVESRVTHGHNNALYIDAAGDVYATGNCTNGGCGAASVERNQMTPVYIGVSNAKSVANSFGMSIVVTTNGNVYYTGAGKDAYSYFGGNGTMSPQKLDMPGEVFDVSAQLYEAYFLVKEGSYEMGGVEQPYGSIYKWDLNPSNAPVKVHSGVDFIQIASGEKYSAAVDKYGEVYTWGENTIANGDGTSEVRTAPSELANVQGLNIRFLTAGADHIAAVDIYNEVYTWGAGRDGKLGTGSDADIATPVKIVDFGNNIRAVYAKYGFTTAVTMDGTMKTVGWHNLIYQGTGYNRDYQIKTISFDKPVLDLGGNGTTGDTVTFMDQYGKMWGWKGNLYGRLGNGNTTETHEIVEMLPGAKVVASNMSGDNAWSTEVTVTETRTLEAPTVEPIVEETTVTYSEPEVTFTEPVVSDPESTVVKNNRGHGNNTDGVDNDNPGKGLGGPNAYKDMTAPDTDEGVKGGAASWKAYAEKQAAAEMAHKVKIAKFLAVNGTAEEKADAAAILSALGIGIKIKNIK